MSLLLLCKTKTGDKGSGKEAKEAKEGKDVHRSTGKEKKLMRN